MTKYYLSFTPYAGTTLSPDGGTLYQVSDVGFGATQSLNIGSQAAGAGKIAFDPLTFTTSSSNLTVQLDTMLASGTPFEQVNLYGFDSTSDGTAVPVLHDVFKLAAAQSDTIDAASGEHKVALEYGGLVESSVPLNADGSTGTPVTAGWNRVTNVSDSNLKTSLDGAAVNLPAADPSMDAVAPGPSGPRDLYVRFTGYDNSVLGGGWIPLASAGLSFDQTLNIGSQATSVGAGKVTFDPLTLSFAPGTTEPTLFKDEAAGVPFKQVEIASYTQGTGTTPGTLVDDYLFGLAAVQTSSHSVDDGTPSQTYTLQYGTEQIQHTITAPDGSTTTTTGGWDATKNVKLDTMPIGATTTDTPIKANLASIATGEAAACFVSGTHIRTTRGDVAVEHLAVGDIVVTVSGVRRPITWLGHRDYRCAGHSRPQDVLPIRIRAHAMGDARPSRDIAVSPGHSICLDVLGEILIPASALVNGTSVVQEVVHTVTYWHVELDSHDIILAENLPCESYLDMGNRGLFKEAGVVDLAAGPDADPARRTHADFCRPFHADGKLVQAVRERLWARAEAFGWQQQQDDLAGLHLVVHGARPPFRAVGSMLTDGCEVGSLYSGKSL